LGAVAKQRAVRILLTASFLMLGSAACHSAPSPYSTEVALACDLAVGFRDQWVRENPSAEAAVLQVGEIVGIQRLGPEHWRTWHVTFMTETGGDQPEGMHHYYVHIHFVIAGADVRLLQVERGPDAIS
jgi:hypothetical protein